MSISTSGSVSAHPLRVNAYVLVADPNYLAQSLASYYDRVTRIVLCYDQSATSWTGTPLPLDACLAIIRELDVKGKCIDLRGHFARLECDPLDNDTYQRQAALDAASDGADWVVQLDTDEVMLSPNTFFEALDRADRLGNSGLDYPSRWLYSRVAPGRYLEATRRSGAIAASFPGPLAVRAGTRLRLARQADVPRYLVDFAPEHTDPWGETERPVHQVIAPDEAVLHFSWVRTHEVIQRKFGWSGHTEDMRAPAVYRRWAWRTEHPYLTAATSPLRPKSWYRVSQIEEPPGGPPYPLGPQ